MNSFDPFISSDYHNDFKDETPIESQLCLAKKTESEFLSEILSYSFSAQNKDVMDHTEPYSIQERQSQNFKNGQSSSSIIQSQDSKKNSSKNSPFHNFQKHLVITLRQILTLKPLSIRSGIEVDIAQKIFAHFKNSQKTSRKFLQQIYGLFDDKGSQSCSDFIKSIRKGDLQDIIGEQNDETIVEAHKILRHFTTIQLQESDLQEVLAHRKIEKKRQFIEYINLFKKELIEGKQRKKTYKLLAKKFNKS